MIYLDASVIVAVLVDEPHSARARSWLKTIPDWPILSAFAATETAAAISRGLRTGRFTEAQARAALDDLDALRGQCECYWPGPEAFDFAEALVREFRLKLAAPDALHLACTKVSGSTLATFDTRLAEAARALGVSVELG